MNRIKSPKVALFLLFMGVIALTAYLGEYSNAEAQVGVAVTRLSAAFPTGDRGTSVLLVEVSAPSESFVGKPFDYDMIVTNLTVNILEDVEIEEELSSNFELSSATPQATPVEGKPNTIKWALGTLGPKQSTNIKFTGTGLAAGEIMQCFRARYVPKACIITNVSEPLLALRKTAPERVIVCDPIPFKFIVSNPGTGTATGVKITDSLPDGLATVTGDKQITFDVGTLGPGQSREFAADVKAARTGTYVNTAMATSAEGLTAEAKTTTTVHEPVLAITKVATREWQYMDRNVIFNMSVTNKGDWVASNTRVEDPVPSGHQFGSADNGGQFISGEGKVTWNFGDLQPGDTREFSMTVVSRQFGIMRNTATATAVCAAPVSASAQVEIRGVPGVLLEVGDIEDPVELGNNVIYVITVTNQGTTDAQNVTIVATVQEEGEYVSATPVTPNATQVESVDGRVIRFVPVPTLPPRAKVEWRVTAKALRAGDTRFKLDMTTRRLETPVTETESTEFYQ